MSRRTFLRAACALAVLAGIAPLSWLRATTAPIPSAVARDAERWISSLRPRVAVPDTEQADWLAAMRRFAQRAERDDFIALDDFLGQHPQGAWATPLRLRFAEELYLTGHYSRAVRTLGEVWAERVKPGAQVNGVLYVHAGVKLAELYARLGRVEQVQPLLAELAPLRLGSADTEVVRSIQQGVAIMLAQPEKAFRCGSLALERLRVFENSTNAGHRAILSSRSTTQGMSLADLSAIAGETGMNYTPCFRSPGAALVTPSVMHLKLGHFVAVVRERNGKAQIEDPTGWQTSFATPTTLDAESSGYFLVPAGDLPAGWRRVDAAEAATVWGRNGVLDNDPDGATKRDARLSCGGNDGRSASTSPFSQGMASYDIHLMLVSQQIIDTPVGYAPPFGPPVYVTLRHTQRANERFGYRPEWTHSWSGELYEDPRTPLGDIWLQDEGGWERFSPLDDEGTAYQGRVFNVGRLLRTTPTEIAWVFPDGTERIYTTPSPTNIVWARIFYLSGIQDASGNRVSIQVLPSGRVESITDPLGQVTHFFYELPDPGIPPTSDPANSPVIANSDYSNQVTRVVDPFGRVATFQYAKVERYVSGYCDGGSCDFGYYNYDLTNITDVAGMSSQFVYDSSGQVVNQLTTPYGTTSFTWSSPYAGSYALNITDPEGDTERVEFGVYPPGDPLWQLPLGMRTASETLGPTVAHWGKKAYAQAYSPGSTNGATLYSFQLNETLYSAGRALECVKAPLENRVWFNYAGQGDPTVPGIGDQPTRIGRVLDDGTTQLWQMERDAWGNVIRSVDPLGRTFAYIYSANFLDLLEVRQTQGTHNELLMQAQYDEHHHLNALTDAAGQTTRYTYNPRGQITRVVNALGQATDLTYDANGYLLSVDGPLPGVQDLTSFTYDAAGRVHTARDPDGYVITIDYDALDRVTKISFPDGTSQDRIYDRMEVGAIRDRLGRETHFSYDGLRRIAAVQDALGHTTRFQWCGCGSLAALIDPLGRMTQWQRDLQGRVTAKEYADGTKVFYEYEHSTSRLHRRRDEKNQLTEFGYDLSDSVLSQVYFNTERPMANVSFTYDPFYPRLASMTDGEGLTQIQYFPVNGSLGAGKIASVDGPWANDVVTYTYDALGRTVATAINGVGARSTYDPAGRVTKMTNVLGEFTFTFEGGTKRLSGLSYPNAQRSEFAYADNLREHLLQRVTHFLPAGTKLSEFTYGYNAEGLITNWTQFQAGRLKTWWPSNDPVDRLTNLVESVSGGPQTATSWAYDDAGNRTVEQVGGVVHEFTFNALNQLAGFSTNTAIAPSAYEWDARNRLTAISNATGRVEFGYDGLDRRIRMTVRSGTNLLSDHRYLWCGNLLCEERDSSGATVLKRYSTYGLQNVGAPEMPPGNYFFTRDHLQSIREVSADTTAAFDYSPSGEQQRLSGTFPSEFGFTGHFQVPDGSTLLAPFRAYSPKLARWLSHDPLGEAGGLNLYAYVELDPINRMDPLGLFPSWADVKSAAKKLFQKTKPGKVEKEFEDFDKDSQKILDTELEVKEALADPDCGHSGARLLKKLLDFLPKSIQLGPINSAELFGKTLDEGVKNTDASIDKMNQRMNEIQQNERN